MKKYILILIFLVLIGFVSAQEAIVIKESKNVISEGEELDVTIIFNNPHNYDNIFEIKETLPDGINLIEPSNADNFEYNDGILKRFYKWQIKLKPSEIIFINYTIRPTHLGEYGIAPTIIVDTSNNSTYISNSLQFKVFCISNNICSNNENYLNCPIDCGRGAKDNICDYKIDNVCDPDCTKDPDCGLSDKNPYYLALILLILMIVISLINYFNEKYMGY